MLSYGRIQHPCERIQPSPLEHKSSEMYDLDDAHDSSFVVMVRSLVCFSIPSQTTLDPHAERRLGEDQYFICAFSRGTLPCWKWSGHAGTHSHTHTHTSTHGSRNFALLAPVSFCRGSCVFVGFFSSSLCCTAISDTSPLHSLLFIPPTVHLRFHVPFSMLVSLLAWDKRGAW